MSLTSRRERVDGRTTIFLKGAIDEHAELDPVFAELPAEVEFHLRLVDRINSVGINRWVPRIEACVRARPTRIAALSYPLVFQANCVSNLFGGAPVLSCMAPYFCEGCGDRVEELIRAEEIAGSAGEPPARSCRVCQGTLLFDELDTYFSLFRP